MRRVCELLNKRRVRPINNDTVIRGIEVDIRILLSIWRCTNSHTSRACGTFDREVQLVGGSKVSREFESPSIALGLCARVLGVPRMPTQTVDHVGCGANT